MINNNYYRYDNIIIIIMLRSFGTNRSVCSSRGYDGCNFASRVVRLTDRDVLSGSPRRVFFSFFALAVGVAARR